MKDEIKEILNQLEIVARKHVVEVCEDDSKIETMPASVVNELRLNNYSAKLLLDYITNLQEELKSANESITWWTNRFKAVERDNERLKQLCDKYEEEYNTIFNEWKETIIDKYQTLKNLQEQLIEYQKALDETTSEKMDLQEELEEQKRIEQADFKTIQNLEEENERLKEKLNCKEYFSSTMPENTEFVILTKENYDRQQKDIELELIDYKSRNENAIVILNNIYLLDNVSISNNAVKEIDKAINILNGGDEEC